MYIETFFKSFLPSTFPTNILYNSPLIKVNSLGAFTFRRGVDLCRHVVCDTPPSIVEADYDFILIESRAIGSGQSVHRANVH